MKSKVHEYKNKYLMMSKTTLTLLTIFFITISSFAQQGINYKALIKDNNGNTLIDTNIVDVQFTIYEGADLINEVYYESRPNVLTDTNGILIINIGEGVTNYDFSDIIWGNDEHWLNVQIDIGDGLVDMGTTQLMAVPYAFHAQTAANISGLEKVTDSINSTTGNPIYGWRLVGKNPDYYGNIGEEAVDLSYSISSSNPFALGATGSYSFATGFFTRTSGDYSTAMGYYTNASGGGSTAMGYDAVASGFTSLATGFGTTASGDHSTTMGSETTASEYASTAMGHNTTASGVSSTAMGSYTTASGHFSTALGSETTAKSFAETAIGVYNTDYTQIDSTAWAATDRLFVIGNGQGYNGQGFYDKSDALMVLKNGTITAPSFDITEIIDDKALITKEYADTNLIGSGLEQITESGNTGWRLIGRNPIYYGNIGNNAVDLSYTIYNPPSLDLGATGFSSTAMGGYTTASGDNSAAMGWFTDAPSLTEIVVGSLNTIYTPTGGNGTWNSQDRIFVIGNGNPDTNVRNNALTVLKNGKTGINTSNPQSLLEVTHQDGGPTPSNLTNAFSIKNSNSDKSWQFHVNSLGALVLYRNGVYTSYFHETSGAYVTVSDRRLKKDITALENGTLNKVMQLNPVSYLIKDQTDNKRNLGLISQEVQELFPSITHYVEEADLITLSYTELIPILIKALQEQQTIIEAQNAKDGIQDNAIETLVARLNLIESKSSH